MTNTSYKAAAETAYAALKTAYIDTPVFWRNANALDTILDYYRYVDSSDAMNFAATAVAGFTPAAGDWYDDFGWWVVAAFKAVHSKPYAGTAAAQQFQLVLQTAWTSMIGAPFAWDNTDQQQFAQYAPYFSGGVWNCVLAGENYPGGNTTNGGRQNTVTNALFLQATSNLARHPYGFAPTALANSNGEYGFLNQWFHQAPAGYSMLYPCDSNNPQSVIVSERVGKFDGSGSDPWYFTSLAWAGDQGLMLAGLIARMELVGKDDPTYSGLLSDATNILNGARTYLTQSTTLPPHVLCPWWGGEGDPPGNDATDYWTGIAVYMRHLIRVFNFAPMKSIVAGSDYQQFLTANANYVVNGPQPESGYPLIDRANDLARLVAAMVCT